MPYITAVPSANESFHSEHAAQVAATHTSSPTEVAAGAGKGTIGNPAA